MNTNLIYKNWVFIYYSSVLVSSTVSVTSGVGLASASTFSSSAFFFAVPALRVRFLGSAVLVAADLFAV